MGAMPCCEKEDVCPWEMIIGIVTLYQIEI